MGSARHAGEDELRCRGFEDKFAKGMRTWSFENVQKEIIPYPNRNELDEMVWGMEDEGTTDPEGTVCDEDDEGEEEDSETENEPDAFDPSDWVDPVAAKETYGAADAHVLLHCHGASEVATCGTQSSHIASFHSRVRVYQEVEDSLKAVITPRAQSLAQRVNKANREDTARLAELLCQKQLDVYAGLQEKLVADGRENHRMQKEYQDLLTSKLLTSAKIKACKEKLKHASQQIGRSQGVVAAMAEAEAFTPRMLGYGRPSGGTKDHRDARFKVLERARRIGNLTVRQKGQWDFVKTSWDGAMCEAHGGDWGKAFAEFMQKSIPAGAHRNGCILKVC